MDRRSFMTKGIAAATALPVSAAFLNSAKAMAADDSGWIDIPLPPGVPAGSIKLKLLWGNPQAASASLLKFAPNFEFGAHSHPEGEYAFLIEGEAFNYGLVSEIGEELAPEGWQVAGDYGYAPPKSIHRPGRVGPKGATIFTFTPAPLNLDPTQA